MFVERARVLPRAFSFLRINDCDARVPTRTIDHKVTRYTNNRNSFVYFVSLWLRNVKDRWIASA
jgi:hypothetical protein